jgi:prepilin-type N-terminal cleavage/methylation domain-containing protein
MSRRQGFTLVELLIALSLALLVSGAALTLMQQRQRFYRDLSNILTARMHVRDATAILAAELRGATPNDSIYLAADTAVELFTTIGVSVVCTAPTNTLITLPPDSSTGPITTTLLAPPDSNDAISLFHDSTAITPSAHWTRHSITNTSHPLSASACPATSTYTTPADIAAGRHSYELSFATPSSPSIHPGTPTRLLRRARYSLYRSASQWYLGYRRCSSIGCAAIQPISGPYAGASGGTSPPLTFRYFDTNGTELIAHGPTTAIARIDIIARATTPHPVSIPGFARTKVTDSSVTSIALRNAL